MNNQRQNASSLESPEATAEMLNGMLNKAQELVQHIDLQNNILVGLSSGIFIFSVSQWDNGTLKIPFFLLSCMAALSALASLLAVHPPKFMRKRGQEESLMYNKRVADFKDAKEYQEKISAVLDSREAIVQQYSIEIYNLYKYYYRPKRQLFKLARNILILSIVLGLIGFLIS